MLTVELNTIYNMDCFELMKHIPDNYFDLVLTDPPYGTTKNVWDKVVDLDHWWEEIQRINKGATICFCAQPFTTDLIISNRKNFRYSLVWDKVLPVGFLNANRMPLRSHEDICVFYDKLPFYNAQKSKGHDRKTAYRRKNATNNNYGDCKADYLYDSTERFPKSILKFSNGGTRNDIVHPTQKPLSLIEYILRLYAKPNFKVFDPFIGSGTTVVGCKSLGIDFVGCDIQANCVDISNKRLEAVQGVCSNAKAIQ